MSRSVTQVNQALIEDVSSSVAHTMSGLQSDIEECIQHNMHDEAQILLKNQQLLQNALVRLNAITISDECKDSLNKNIAIQ